MKVGLFFGTFDPIHLGHLGVARWFLRETDLTEVWLVVSPLNPFKDAGKILGERERLHMAGLAIQGESGLRICDEEFQLPRPSRTIRTLEELRKKYPENEFVLLIGEDNLFDFHLWAEYQNILNGWEVWVYPREGKSPANHVVDPSVAGHPHLRRFDAPKISISSTEIRSAAGRLENVDNLLAGPVKNYIEEKNIYRRD